MGWRDVLRAVQDAEARSRLSSCLRTAGFSIDEFSGLIKARETVCEWLTRYEDGLEGFRGDRARERLVVRGVRRSLECELWP